MADDREAQEFELLALESIFEGDDGILHHENVTENEQEFKSGILRVSPSIPNPPITFINEVSLEGQEEKLRSAHSVSHLCPIVLNFVLPFDYPSKNPPQLTLTCSWLDRVQLSSVSQKLDQIWAEQEGQEVLYNWVQFLQEDLLVFLKLGDRIEIVQEEFKKKQKTDDLDVRVMQDAARFSDILQKVLEYDELKRKKNFDNTLFECQVCFVEKYGKSCIQFKDCAHVYCSGCIKSYFDLQIKEGNMKGLNCPDSDCNSQAYPAQVKDLVSAEDFDRYETLLLQTTLDMMKDIKYCPRKFCQSPVVIEPDEGIGICPECRFSFCPFCNLAYHGVEPCKLKQTAMKEIFEIYKAADGKTRKELETKYGTKILQRTFQNLESERWISSNSKSCPGCGAAIEKFDGCNKMICFKCKCSFCWLCMRRLSKENPYSHYNTVNNKCYGRLFEGVEVDDNDYYF